VTSPGSAERRPLLLLVNPTAGGKPASGSSLSDDAARLRPEALAEGLTAHGLDVTLRVLAEGDDVGQLARAAAERHDVVAAGGDGTVGPAGLALIDGPATLGIIALGSFNNVAHGLGLPDSLDEALTAIGRGQVTRVDVGLARREGTDAEPFLEAGGIGLDAIGFHAVELAERRGVWRGARFLWRALRRSPSRIELVVDGSRTVIEASSVVICNGPYHGAGFAIAPDADPTDGQLDVATFGAMGRTQTLIHYLRVARGRRVSDVRVRIERGTEVAVRTLRGTLPVHVDGRSIGVTPVTFTVRRGALRIFR
jgi:diacylglycerol kinase (ATP)